MACVMFLLLPPMVWVMIRNSRFLFLLLLTLLCVAGAFFVGCANFPFLGGLSSRQYAGLFLIFYAFATAILLISTLVDFVKIFGTGRMISRKLGWVALGFLFFYIEILAYLSRQYCR